MNDSYTFVYKNETYIIFFCRDHKLKRTAHFEVKEDKLICRMSLFFSKTQAIQYIEKHKISLSRLFAKTKALAQDEIYIFGEPYAITTINDMHYVKDKFSYGDLKKRDEHLKRLLLKYVQNRSIELERLMGISAGYRYNIRKMKTRYGSNSRKTHRISLSLNLVHYSFPIIDSVIIHELAHDLHFDHSAKFYQEIYRYCPDYEILSSKLRKGEFK